MVFWRDPSAPRRPKFVIVDHEITPNQARNLESATGATVLDRTGVIVEIFHRHAKSREAKLEVEIAPGATLPEVTAKRWNGGWRLKLM